MKHLTAVFTMLMIFATASVMAAPHDHSGHDHGGNKAASHQGHDGHGAAGNMLDLGTIAVEGVRALAEMKDVRAAMAKMGMKTTHHFMVMFTDEKTGKEIDSGKVAVKVTSPDGQVTGPMELMGMQGHFGADLILDQPGAYRFQVGSRLADGEVRQFEFSTVIK